MKRHTNWYTAATTRTAFTNPFRFGDLALGDAFVDREEEIDELRSDVLNGQNVVIFAPRRIGKSSLARRVTEELLHDGVLVARVDLMKTPTKERLAARLAASIYADIASPLFKAREKAAQVFSGLRVKPVMTIDPTDATIGFSFDTGHRTADIDATLERLLELPGQLAASRRRRAALIFDEFQEIVSIDPGLLPLMRSIFQEQPGVAHVYLGSKHHMMSAIFNDEHEPFWRSAKRLELGPIPVDVFRAAIEAQFARTGRRLATEVAAALLAITRGHPYGTQELAYFFWEEVRPGGTGTLAHLERALTKVLRSENTHFQRIWEKASRGQRLTLVALAAEPGFMMGQEYRRRHELPNPSTTQKALGALVDDELVAKEGDEGYRIVEPFLAEWIQRAGL